MDTVVGDSAALFIQIDNEFEDFEFSELDDEVAQSLNSILSRIAKERQDEIDLQAKRLDITERFSNLEISRLLIADVPFYLFIGNDVINLDGQALAVGDFATMGVILSDNQNPTDLPCAANCLRHYVASIGNLRTKPAMESFLPRLALYEIDFFYQRFDFITAKSVQPVFHGDTFATSNTNLIFGDYLNTVSIEYLNGDGNIQNVYVYGDGLYDNYEWMSEPLVSRSASAYYQGQILDWAPDTVVVGNKIPYWQSQKSSTSDVVTGPVQDVILEDPYVEQTLRRLFYEQGTAEKLMLDMYRYSLPYDISKHVNLGPPCTFTGNIFVSSNFVSSNFNARNWAAIGLLTPDALGLSPSPTVTSQPSSLLGSSWYPKWDDTACSNDGHQKPYMEHGSADYLLPTAEACCDKYFKWNVQKCRKKSLGTPMWYPKFDSDAGGCTNDGLEPTYLKQFKMYVFDSKESCCENYYPLNMQNCIEPYAVKDPCTKEFEITYWGVYNEDFLLEPEVGYYPSFSDDRYCVNDGLAPAYLVRSPMHWKRNSRAECCYSYYQYAIRECMGEANNEGGAIELPRCIQQPLLSGKWYVNDIVTEGIYECVRECAGQSPCNGRAPLHLELYDTFTECCHERTWWKPSCVSSSSHNTEPGTSLLSSITEPGMSAGSASSKCSDTFWDTYQQWDSVGYYPVFKHSIGKYCTNDKIALSLLTPQGIESDYWDDKTLAECCRSNFPWPEAFRLCVGDREDGVILPPCSQSPWGQLSNKWYFIQDSGKCVRECYVGESCYGQVCSIQNTHPNIYL